MFARNTFIRRGRFSTKVDGLEERLSKLLSGCAKEAYVNDESDTRRGFWLGIEMRFREEHAAIVEVFTGHKATTNVQTTLL